jgi:hypothetical protein
VCSTTSLWVTNARALSRPEESIQAHTGTLGRIVEPSITLTPRPTASALSGRVLLGFALRREQVRDAGSEAANHEGKEATSGCRQSIERRSSTADLVIDIVGGRTVATPPGSEEPVRIVGGKVSDLELESRKRHVGLLFC